MSTSDRSIWTWWVCGLLLCASAINYMDRQTLTSVSNRITAEFQLNEKQYGQLEEAFGMAFAVGAILFGIVADRMNIRWLYPSVLLLWSLMGFLTGYVQTYAGLYYCRLFLGFFEAGHWPCALKTTQRLLSPERRTLGNSILQSGATLGAAFIPLIMSRLLTDAPGSWRPAFQIIAGVGSLWAFVWVLSTNSTDLAPISSVADPSGENSSADDSFVAAVFSRKFLLLVVVVVCINACWHLFRVWMPKFVQTGRGFSEKSMLEFMFWFYIATDVGCVGAGFLTKRLHTLGFSVHGSRTLTFGLCSLLVAAGGLIPWLSAGWPLVFVLILVACGSLGVFPCYYSFSQDLSTRHQGKVTGLLGTIAWLTSSWLHPRFGALVDQTKSYDLGMASSCGLPLLAFFTLALFWPRNKPLTTYNAP